MSAFEEQPCVGMFGTCGESTFRQDLLIPAYEAAGVTYYNPQVGVGEWGPEMADIEADHLAFDVVQTWPVTGETYAIGTLAEQGFSVASTMRAESPFPKFIVPMVELTLSPELTDQQLRKESIRARKLITAHFEKSSAPNVFLTRTLEEMRDVSIAVYGAAAELVELSRSHTPAFQRFVAGREQGAAWAAAMRSGKLGGAAIEATRRQPE